MQLHELESVKSSSTSSPPERVGIPRPASMYESRAINSIAIQTDQLDTSIRAVRSLGDVAHSIKPTTPFEQLDGKNAENLLSDVVSFPPRPLTKSKSAISFDQLVCNIEPSDLSVIQVLAREKFNPQRTLNPRRLMITIISGSILYCNNLYVIFFN